MPNDLDGALHKVREALEHGLDKLEEHCAGLTYTHDQLHNAIALLDRILEAAREIKDQSEIGNERHQTGCIEQDHTLVCSGVAIMEKARTAQANTFATITKEPK